MKKKTIWNLTVWIVLIIMVAVPFINWEMKKNVDDRFDDIELDIGNSYNYGRILQSCDIVSKFVAEHPVESELALKCEAYEKYNSTNIDSLHNDFFAKVHEIGEDYRKQKEDARRWMFIIYIVSILVARFAWKLIEKYL